MNTYIYQADIYCEDCGKAVCKRLDKAGKRPPNADDETTYDSGEYPKGPYPDGGGEADYDQFCTACGHSLGNPLTGLAEPEDDE